MEKVLITITTVLLGLVVVACGSKTNAMNYSDTNNNVNTQVNSNLTESGNSQDVNSNANNSKAIVIYSSFIGEQYSVGVIEKGNTEIVADMIIEKTGADRYKVEPKIDNYPKDSYKRLTEIASQELHSNARPEIKDIALNIAKYDIIFVGAPVWWGDFPMIMYTLFDLSLIHI